MSCLCPRWAFILLFLTYARFTTSHRHHSRRSTKIKNSFLNFKFLNEPHDVRNSSAILLPCKYKYDSRNEMVKDEFFWSRDGARLLSQSNVLPNGSLYLEEASPADSGMYGCVVKITDENKKVWTFMSTIAQVHISKPKFIAQPEDVVVPPGQAAVFRCHVNASTPLSVRWMFNGRPFHPTATDRIRILPLHQTLEISPVLPHDHGVYNCEFGPEFDATKSTVAKLTVDPTAPHANGFLSIPENQSVLLGSPALLECLTANGKPHNHVEWLRDGSVLIEDGSRVQRISGSLLFTRTVTSDSALYACRSNINGNSQQQTAYLNILEPPRIITPLKDIKTLETTDVVFKCDAKGRPAPSIRWLKNGEALVPSEYFVFSEYTLSILGLVKTDSGVYQCVVSSEAGFATSAAQLAVDSADTSSVAASSGKPLLASSPLSLRTTMIGARSLAIEWDAPLKPNGNLLLYQVFFREEGSVRERSLNSSSRWATLSSLQPQTLYIIRVAAENEAGLGHSSDHIKVTTTKEQAVPGKVTRLSATATGAETIEVHWEPPVTTDGGPEPLRYRLFYVRKPQEKGDRETQITVSSTEYTLHGMDKFTQYDIRVEAEGANGSGISSDTITVRTLSDAPSAPPDDITVEAQSSTAIRVAWKPPPASLTNGELTGYRIKYKTKQRGGKVSTVVVDDPTVTEYNIDGLEPSQHYQLRIAAANQNGTGAFSDWLRADTPAVDKEEKLLGAPIELRPVAGPDFILVTWQPPSDETTIVRAYQIGWGNNVPDVELATVGANVLQYKIENLAPGREYVISVRAKNNVGLGYPMYETVRTGTERGRSGFGASMDAGDGHAATPIAVRAEALSASSVRVSWSDPDPEAFNVKYTVKYSTGAERNRLHYAESSETFVVIESLRPATEYEFAVRASHSGVHSLWSMAVQNRTLSSPPSSAPRDLSLSASPSGDPHQVILHWQPPKYANGELIEYLIYYSDRAGLEDRDWRLVSVPADRLTHSIFDLLPKSTYYFKIQGRNEMGYGPLSPVVTWRGAGAVYTPFNSRPNYSESGDSQVARVVQIVLANPVYLAGIIVIIILLLVLIICIVVCLTKRSTKRKQSVGGPKPGQDLWINHPHGSQLRSTNTMAELMGEQLAELKSSARNGGAIDSPPPRYHALQTGHEMENPYGSIAASGLKPRRPQPRAVLSDERRALIVGRAQPLPTAAYAASEDSGGTLSRSYHHSQSSLEQRTPRTPQVVYTGGGRHQPIAKVELDSKYGSAGHIAPPTPPLAAPPSHTPSEGYRTLRSGSGNPLRSFTSVCPPPQSATVRPVVIAAGGRQVPVGRATAQPRVNLANIYSPYASCSQFPPEDSKQPESHDGDENSQLNPSGSNEELNELTENIDLLMDDLQAITTHFVSSGRSDTAWSGD